MNQNVTGNYPAQKASVAPATVLRLVQSDGLYGTYGYVGVTNTTIIVAFRGASSLENILLRDRQFSRHTAYRLLPLLALCIRFRQYIPLILFPPQPFLMRKFTMASWRAMKRCRSRCGRRQKARALLPAAPVLVLGHSLGGAIAMLAALDLVEHNVSNVKMVTFGQPRVGNDVFAAYFATKARRHASSKGANTAYRFSILGVI